ncbi:hypothetical protein PPL_05036 [Heterostelium album PN500]|uniref:Uncharacterized protein n=1 Tax=Heterostelium pallidum (strain ATCC 26659 / Pp 5 / PN500) TaxID=670386 RepID=D3B992_HETP5|nr:hypothetical protein PPL_05036 [Heterostelium album PN500]EFA82131.1 hypothetical protein PPL_05036 [Heterostelium album PN500]|eukprot:XP_020434248.1 hypothetical protein PPL_05036 [Heterostelium album PN500]
MVNNQKNIQLVLVVLCTIIVVLASFSLGSSGSRQVTSNESFIEKIDRYLSDDSDWFANYDVNTKQILEELFRDALKRVRTRVMTNNDMMFYDYNNNNNADGFEPPAYNQTVVDAFASKTLLNPPVNLTYNPYDIAGFNSTLSNETVCGLLYPDLSDRSTYYLYNYSSAAEAEAAGAFVTHLHPCGYCSNTIDLAMYMKYIDLTNPIRDCDCLDICLKDWIEKVPNNIPVNSTTLNPCLQCDEDKSGPIFKAVAARTRRDSGLRSAINRPPDSIYNITHYYY